MGRVFVLEFEVPPGESEVELGFELMNMLATMIERGDKEVAAAFLARLARVAARGLVACLVLVGGVGVAGPVRAQTGPLFGAGIKNIPTLVEGVITSEAQALGTSLSAASIEGSIGTALATVEASDVAAVGLGAGVAAGSPVLWSAIAAYAGYKAGTTAVACFTEGCSFSGVFESGSYQLAIPNYNATVTANISSALPIYRSILIGNSVVSNDPNGAADYLCNQYYHNSGYSYYGLTTTCTVGGGCGSTCYGSRVIGGNTQAINQTVTSSRTTSFSIPSGGLTGDYFNVGSASSGTLSNTEAVSDPGSPMVLNPLQMAASDATSQQLGEAVDPQVIANIANQVINQINTSGGLGGATSTISGGGSSVAPKLADVAPAQVQTIEAETGYFPTLNDLFQPIASGAVTTVTGSGASQTNGTSATTTLTASSTPTALQQTGQTAAPCGNLLAGENACGETLEFSYNQQTGVWEWQNQTSVGTLGPIQNPNGLSVLPNTAAVTEMTQEVQTLTKLQDMVTTGTATATTTDVLTDPATRLRDLTATQTPTETALQDTLTDTSLPFPPLTLPFNEWPQVFNSFRTANFPSITGTCPTIQLHSTILGATFNIGAQCLVMDALKPYMQYVLPPTYLLIGLVILMSG